MLDTHIKILLKALYTGSLWCSRVYEAAKRYYAEIMMPFRKAIQKNLEKIKDYSIDYIAPSHGPIYREPSFIINA